MADMTPTIEKYTLKIYSIFNQITELEKLIGKREKIRGYSSGDADKIIIGTVLKLQNAKIELKNALDCLLAPTINKNDK
ncbi:MAG: hypothetical protein NTZ95_03960 [Candidatus Omnitrophica bacterium]|nr:hypothetical protein [Candidatus Omnitrophota bacterium]